MSEENVFARAAEAAQESTTEPSEPARKPDEPKGSAHVNSQPASKKFPCTVKGCTKSFDYAKGRGTHLRTAHGIPGSGKSTVQARKKREREALASAGKKHAGRPLGSTIRHGAKPPAKAIVKPLPNKSHHALVQRPVEELSFSPVLVGYAMAKLENLAEQIARENGLPEKEFVREVSARLNGLVSLRSN